MSLFQFDAAIYLKIIYTVQCNLYHPYIYGLSSVLYVASNLYYNPLQLCKVVPSIVTIKLKNGRKYIGSLNTFGAKHDTINTKYKRSFKTFKIIENLPTIISSNIKKYFKSSDHTQKSYISWSKQSVCTALGHCRQNLVANINDVLIFSPSHPVTLILEGIVLQF